MGGGPIGDRAQPTGFPGKRARRVMLVSFVLVVVAMTAAVATA
jgi:hypothetical protein